MSEAHIFLVMVVVMGALMLFFFGAARAAGKPAPKNQRAADEGPFVIPWGILESHRRDRNLEWDEIAIMDDELRRDEETETRDWLDQPGDDDNTGWTNFDYIAAEDLIDDWDG